MCNAGIQKAVILSIPILLLFTGCIDLDFGFNSPTPFTGVDDINTILNNPEEYLGKQVVVEGTLYSFDDGHAPTGRIVSGNVFMWYNFSRSLRGKYRVTGDVIEMKLGGSDALVLDITALEPKE